MLPSPPPLLLLLLLLSILYNASTIQCHHVCLLFYGKTETVPKTWLDCRCISVQFFHSLNWSGRRGDMRDDSTEILFQSLLRNVIVSSTGIGRDVHSLTLSIKRILCRRRRSPAPKVPWRMVLERRAVNKTWAQVLEAKPETPARIAQTTAGWNQFGRTGAFLSVPRHDWCAPLSHPSSCRLVNHGL